MSDIPYRLKRPPEADYQGDYRMEFRDSGNIDAFGRLRVSLPVPQWNYTNQYGVDSTMLETWVSGTGTTSHDPNSSSIIMSTGGGLSGAKCSRQTKRYFRYTPGKSFLVFQSGVFGAAKTGVRRRRGLFDDQNGVFCEQTENGVYFVVRSYTTGAVVDNAVRQDQWNIDVMDGNGESGIILDMSKSQIVMIDLEWLGSGRVRVGFIIDGHFYYVHEFKHANYLANAYMTTANLPLRAEIENTAAASGASTLQLICATVIIEGDGDKGGYFSHVATNGITPRAITTRQAIIAIRPKATINGLVNRATIQMVDLCVRAITNDLFWEVVYNPTLGGTPVWVSNGPLSAVEYDISGTTITGGDVIDSGFAIAGQGNTAGVSETQLDFHNPITLDHAGANPVILCLVGTAFTGTSNASAIMHLREYY